jgi:hypothetical protein
MTLAVQMLLSFLLPLFPADFDCFWRDYPAAELFRDVCSGCHGHEKADPSSKSPDEWPATVERMRNMAVGSKAEFTGEEASEVSEFLVKAAASTPVSDNPGETSSGAALLEAAATIGFAVGALISIMLITGLARRRLRRNFRLIHITGAVMLFACIAAHAVLLYAEFGIPSSFWHAMGSMSSASAFMAAAAGIGRRRLGKKFLPVHVSFGFAALALAVLHRILSLT